MSQASPTSLILVRGNGGSWGGPTGYTYLDILPLCLGLSPLPIFPSSRHKHLLQYYILYNSCCERHLLTLRPSSASLSHTSSLLRYRSECCYHALSPSVCRLGAVITFCISSTTTRFFSQTSRSVITRETPELRTPCQHHIIHLFITLIYHQLPVGSVRQLH